MDETFGKIAWSADIVSPQNGASEVRTLALNTSNHVVVLGVFALPGDRIASTYCGMNVDEGANSRDDPESMVFQYRRATNAA